MHFSAPSESTWSICSVTAEGHLRYSLGDHRVPWKRAEMDEFEVRELVRGSPVYGGGTSSVSSSSDPRQARDEQA